MNGVVVEQFLGRTKYKSFLELEADRFAEGEGGCSALKRHTSIWGALKPMTFTALALKPSTGIKSVKRKRQREAVERREREGKRGIAEKKIEGC